MKRILVLIAFAPLLATAQDSLKEHGLRELTFGVMITSLATHTFGDKASSPFIMAWTLAPSLNIVTRHTHDHIMFDVGNDAIETLNGYLLPKNWDAYNFLSKSLATKDAYGSIGIEKVLPIAEGMEFVFFAEVGTNFSGVHSTTIGIVAHPQFSLKKTKAKG